MGLFNNLAYTAGRIAGEAKRKRESEQRVSQQDPQTREYVKNLQTSEQNGNLESMYNLGCYHSTGTYVVLDFDKACYWWTQAAERGDISAQYNLGILYDGNLSPYIRDDNLAGYWFNCAANNGLYEAREALRGYQYSRFYDRWIKR